MASSIYSEELALISERVVYSTSTFDPSTRLPLVIMNSTAFPKSPDDYTPELMAKLIERLPKTSYALVFFACGAPNKPSWSWISKIYAMLDRQVKKRVDKVYIVHESWWVRAVTEMFRGVVSSKFKKKILHISSLSDLAKHIDITKLNIPLQVYIHNLKVEATITIPRHYSPVFGVPLHRSGTNVIYPSMWEECCKYLKITGIFTRDIFLREDDEITWMLRDSYDRGQTLDLDDYGPHQASSIIKLYLRELPNPILPIRYIPLPIQDNVDYIHQVYQSLPYVTQKFLYDLLPIFIAVINNSHRTGHTSNTIAIAMASCFIGRYSNRKDTMAVAIRYTKNLIELWQELEERLAEYSESDTSDSEDEEKKVPHHRKKSFNEGHHPSIPSHNHNHHSIKPIFSHQNMSADFFSASEAHGHRSVSMTLPQRHTASATTLPGVRKVSSISSVSSSASSASSVSITAAGKPLDNICVIGSQSEESLSSSTPANSTTVPNLPPPPPKLRKSVSTILRPTTSSPDAVPPMPKLNTRCSFGSDLNKQQTHLAAAGASGYSAAVAAAARNKPVPTKRGRMVAELAKLYEERNSLATSSG